MADITLEQFKSVAGYLHAKREQRHQTFPFLCEKGCDCRKAHGFDRLQRMDAAIEMTPEGEAIPYDGSHTLDI